MTPAILLCITLLGETPLPVGDSRIEVETAPGPLEVFTYKPDSYRDGPLILVFHGVLRNAEEYRDHARGMGDRFGALIAAPHFDLKRFPIEAYQQGNVIRQGRAVPEGDRTGAIIPKLVAEFRRREGRDSLPYHLIGHSGGGQFLVRLAGFIDTEAASIVAANSGTYLWPSNEFSFPYGFGGLPLELTSEASFRRYLAQPLTIYLGTADVIADEHFDQRPQVQPQGASRLERGRRVYEFARDAARARGWAFHWRLIEAPGVHHDHELMFNHPRCREALFGLPPAQVVAHRGLLRESPENTLATFRAALNLRLGFEFDVRRTRDGCLVCLHDESVDRTTDGRGKVVELTLDEVRRLDAGRWFSPIFSGEQVPTIDELFAVASQYPPESGLLAVDIKGADESIEEDLVALARKHNLLERLVFIGRAIEEPDVRRRLKAADRRARVARLVTSAADVPAAIADDDSDWLYLRHIATPEEVRQVQRAGKRVFIAGPVVAGNEPANWQTAASVGYDAILTDYPLELRRVLKDGRMEHEPAVGSRSGGR